MHKIQRSILTAAVLSAGLLVSSGAHAYWSFNQSITPTTVVGDTGDGVAASTGITVQLGGIYAANGAGNVGFAAGATGNWSAGTLQLYAGNGQGMSTGTDSTTVGAGGQVGVPFHALDNNVNTEAVVLKFSDSVVLSSIGLGHISDNNTTTNPDKADLSVFRYIGAGTPAGSPALVGQGAAAMTGWELVGNYADLVVDTNNPYNGVNTGAKGSSWWMISAYNSAWGSGAGLEQGNDYFKLFAVAGSKCTSLVAGVCGPGGQAPEPSSLALMSLGVLGIVGMRRRQLGGMQATA